MTGRSSTASSASTDSVYIISMVLATTVLLTVINVCQLHPLVGSTRSRGSTQLHNVMHASILERHFVSLLVAYFMHNTCF